MRGRGADPIVDLLADEIDSEGGNADAKSRKGVAELIGEHGMLPPFIPSPEEFSCCSQRFSHLSSSPIVLLLYYIPPLVPIVNC